MEQDRDGVRKGPAGALLTCRATEARCDPAPLPFLPGNKKDLTEVTARGLHSWEEVVESKDCTRLPTEGAVFKLSKSLLLTPYGHAAGVTQPRVELLGSTAASRQEETLGGEVWRLFGSINTFCCLLPRLSEQDTAWQRAVALNCQRAGLD